jgi:transporter family-2 protein
MKIIWMLIAIASGALLPIQAGLNTRLGRSIESPVYASLISFVVGAAGLIAFVMLTKQHASWSGIREVPAYVWLAGIVGAFCVTGIILAFPHIGPGLTFGFVVAGQMIVAILLDHFKVLVAQQHGINMWRLGGVALIILGVIIIRKF